MISFNKSLLIFSAILLAASSPTATAEKTAEPIVSGPDAQAAVWNDWTCRPLDAGPCAAPHSDAAMCDETPSCCPGSIITDWRTGKLTCSHGSSAKSNGDDTALEALEVGDVSLEVGISAAASPSVVAGALLSTAVLARGLF